MLNLKLAVKIIFSTYIPKGDKHELYIRYLSKL